MTNFQQPWCLSKENGFVQAVIGLGGLLAGGGMVVLILRITLKLMGYAEFGRLLAANAGMCCKVARETYDECR
jgi:hypothetical protein